MTLTLIVECLKCGWFREVMPPDPKLVPSECPTCASRLLEVSSEAAQESEPPPAADPRADDGDCNVGDPSTGFTLADLAKADETYVGTEIPRDAQGHVVMGPGIEAGRAEQQIREGIAKLEDSILHHTIERDGWTPEDECYRKLVAEVVTEISAPIHAAEDRARLAEQDRDTLRMTELPSGWVAAPREKWAEVERLQGELGSARAWQDGLKEQLAVQEAWAVKTPTEGWRATVPGVGHIVGWGGSPKMAMESLARQIRAAIEEKAKE